MIVVKLVFYLFSSLVLADAIDLPPFFTKCRKSDPKLNDCILKNIVDNWPTFVKGDETYHIQKMNPLSVSFMRVNVDNFHGNLTNSLMSGFEQMIFKSIDLNLNNQTIEIFAEFPVSGVVGTYEFSGSIIGLPLSDIGTLNITFIGILERYQIKYQLIERKGKEYIQITDCKINSEKYERAYFQVKFSRSQQLTDTINQVFNDNWKEIYEQTEKNINKPLSEIYKSVLQSFFDRVPFSNFFAD